MFVILAYDVDVSRVSKVMKICREYLFHIQNSLFEGDITEAKLIELKQRISEIIGDDDSVILYEFAFIDSKFYSRTVLGVGKQPTNIF